ncbi:MAG: hypothetical protein A3D24_00015 [Candidatus Blackburnbacteria bacterium RIFCSPHIGHO2_02_FULL_39_13]|nr:MAG: hypothetical protein A3D24_00015 [Candidatus Blackburnbacteria bacterium RIFCSPHIGHO2_02_FULL_39_13]
MQLFYGDSWEGDIDDPDLKMKKVDRTIQIRVRIPRGLYIMGSILTSYPQFLEAKISSSIKNHSVTPLVH